MEAENRQFTPKRASMKKYICEGLAEYLAKDVAPWHMPGHKRKYNMDRKLTSQSDIELATHFEDSHINQALSLTYKMDVTEVPGTDDLHHPEDMILKSQQELARVYGTYASYYMVNGSTGGILTAVGAVASVKQKTSLKIIIARNCHKSVFNAVQLFNLNPVYLEPELLEGQTNTHIYGGISPQQLKSLVDENPDVIAVVITSPTYEGILSDVAGIKKVLEPYQIPLIVDEAHGAHLRFIDELPKSAVDCGGDIVVQSLHKTLPALTQTAILHVNNPIYDAAVRKYLSVFMSSSPSYVMLCSMEGAVACAEERARSESGFDDYVRALKEFRCKCENLQNLRLLADENSACSEATCYAQDISRLVIYTCNQHIHPTGQQLEDELRNNYNIQVEMSGLDYVVLISTFADEEQDFERLYEALKQMDSEMVDRAGQRQVESTEWMAGQCENEVAEYVAGHASEASIETLRGLIGTKSKSNIYVYPPGSYIVTEGEVITEEAVNILEQLASAGKKIYVA